MIGAPVSPTPRPTGIDRRGDHLLSLEDEAMPARAALITLTRHLLSATLVGHQAPIVAEMYQRISNPQLGDLLVEQTTVLHHRPARRDGDWYRGFGYLIERRREWRETDQEWERSEESSFGDDNRVAEDVWYIQYGPAAANVCRWANAEFLVVPVHVEWRR